MTWTQGISPFYAGWRSVLKLPAYQLNWGTRQVEERGLDTLRAWKSICWKFLEECSGVGNSTPQLPPPSLSCSVFHHASCLDVETSALFLVPSIFHVKTGKYLMGCWCSGFTGSADVFQEIVKFKTCTFLVSLLLPASSFLGCMAHEYIPFSLPDRKTIT